jgi:endo-1,4-beta-xylanase
LRRQFLAAAAAAAAASAAPRLAAAAPIEGLRQIAASRGLLFGSMVRGDVLPKDPAYADLIARECNLFVSREVHFDYFEPRRGAFDFSRVDPEVAWAERHRMQFRGNALVWGEHAPAWFAALEDKADAIRALEDHLDRVCRHFAGRVQSWDVVNEAIKLEDGRPDGLRRTVFLDRIGPEYLDIAFHTARAADPKAKLVYNDFDLELGVSWEEDRRRVLLELLDGFKKRGVPIDAVGIQSHLKTATFAKFDDKVFAAFLQELADRGVGIMLSELDVSDRNAPADIARRDALVASVYRRYLDVALANRAVGVVVSWGLTDADRWVNSSENRERRADGLPARPLPFDAEYAPKPAYVAIAEALDAAPKR